MAKRKYSESSFCDTNDTEEECVIPIKSERSVTDVKIPFSRDQSSSCDPGLSRCEERDLQCPFTPLYLGRKDDTKIQNPFEEIKNQMKLQQCKEDDLDSTGTMMITKRNTVDGLQSPASSIPLTLSNTSKVSPFPASVQSCSRESSRNACAQKLQFDLPDKDQVNHLLRKYIQWNYIHLKQNLDPDGIADKLCEFDIIDDAERTKIQEAGYHDIKSDILLKFLVRYLEKMPKGDDTFIGKVFSAFEQADCEYLLTGFASKDFKYKDNIDTNEKNVPDIWKEKLSDFEQKSGDELDAKQIIDKLLQKEVLEFDEHENIQDMKFKPDKLKYLIKYIQKKTSREFYNFVQVLEEEYPHICNDLKDFEIMDISISTDTVSSSVSIIPMNIKTSNSEGYVKMSELKLSLPPNGRDIEQMVVDSCENENNDAVTEEMMELGATGVLKYECACIRLTLMHLSTRSKMQIYSKLQDSPEKFSNILKHLFTHEHFRMMKERNIHSIDFRLEMAWPDAIITRDVIAEHYCFLKDKIEPNYFVDLLKCTNAPEDVIDAIKDMQKSRPSRCTQFLLFLVNDENSPIDMFHAKLKELKMDDVINVLMSSSKQISNRLCSCRLTKSGIVKHFSQLVQEMKDVDGLLDSFSHFSGFDKSIKKSFEELRNNDKLTSNDNQKQSSNNEQNKAQMFLRKILDMSENEASEGVCLLEEEIRKTEQGEMLLKRVLEKRFKTEECAIMITRNDIKRNRSFLRSQLEPRRFLDMLRDIDGIDEEREKISSQLPKQTRCDIFLGLLENHKVALEKFGPALKRFGLTKIIQFLYNARTQGSEEYKITKGDIERNSGFLQEELEPINFLNMIRGIKGTDEDIENILPSCPRRIRCLRFYNILLNASEIDLEKLELELKQRNMAHVIAFLINSRPGRYHDTTHIKEALVDSYKCVIDEIEPRSLKTIFLEREVYTKEEFEEICSPISRRARAINLMQDIMKGPVSKSRCLMNSLDAVGYISLVKMIRKEIDAFKTCPRLFKKTHGITDCCLIEGQFEIEKIHGRQMSTSKSEMHTLLSPTETFKQQYSDYCPSFSVESDIEKPSLKRSLTSGDDDVVLDPFLCSKEIRKLIESGKLPSQKILDEMCQIYERKSKEITITCKAICEHIKSKDATIAYVWAAYTIQNPHRITFVVIVEHKSEGETSTEPLKLDKLITYSFVSQYVGEFNSEGLEVLRQETSASEGLDEESYQKLQSCISKHSEDLMKRHKYLSIISACSKRSKGFGASWNQLPEKCIVLYVQKKNYIPIDEEPFQTNYDGIPVDVREGAFIPFGRTAKDLLDPVKMGSQIGGDINKGTLGFFIDHPQFGICGLTCAHVLLTRWEMTQLKTNHSGTLKWPLHRMCKNVYQPADNQSVLGHTVQVIYKEGSDENCGMELALFRITDRHPKSPSFPDVTGSNVATSIKYDSWRMCSTDRLNKKEDAKVIKFGSGTELSYGRIRFDTISVKSLDAYPLVHEYAPIQLFKQIEVKALLNDIPFAENGDSGAPVFVVEKNSENKCIGIVEGGTTYGTIVVTPIVPILAELDVPCLKSFDTEKELSNIQNKIDDIETQVQRIGSDMQTIKQLLLNHPQNFDSSMTNSSNDQHGHA